MAKRVVVWHMVEFGLQKLPYRAGRFVTCLGERLKLVLARSYVLIVS
jgi:hypothetical protein